MTGVIPNGQPQVVLCERPECGSADTMLDRQTADALVWHCKSCRHTWVTGVPRQRP